MTIQLNKESYTKLINEDIDKIKEFFPEHSLEKSHIIDTLNWAIDKIYGSHKEKIICAAILIEETGKVYLGHRHNHCIEALNGELSWTLNRQEISKVKKIQGFMTSNGRFVDRKEAFKIAQFNNQIIDPKQINGDELYSENLY